MRRKVHNITALLEFLVGAGLAIFFHWVLHYEEAAYVIFGAGLLLSLATYLLRDDLAHLSDRLSREYHNAHELTFMIAQIGDPECQIKAQELVASTKKDLSLLQHGLIPLDETEFYLAAAKALDQASHHVKAVDPLTDGWETRGALVNFYQANLRALERKTWITRVFVLRRDQLQEPETQKVLLSQLRDGIDVRVAHREELPSNTDAGSWANNCSFDFALYDDRVVTDVYPRPGTYYGIKTCQPKELSKYHHLYDLIEHNSHGVAMNDGVVVLAGGINNPSPTEQALGTTINNKNFNGLRPPFDPEDALVEAGRQLRRWSERRIGGSGSEEVRCGMAKKKAL